MVKFDNYSTIQKNFFMQQELNKADFIKFGPPVHSENVTKYNRLLDIENRLEYNVRSKLYSNEFSPEYLDYILKLTDTKIAHEKNQLGGTVKNPLSFTAGMFMFGTITLLQVANNESLVPYEATEYLNSVGMILTPYIFPMMLFARSVMKGPAERRIKSYKRCFV